MPPVIALIICLIAIGYFIRWDINHLSSGGNSLWLPTVFVLLAASRPVSWWLDYASRQTTLLDTAVNTSFLIGGFATLRRVWEAKGEVGGRKGPSAVAPTLILFLTYCAISLLWSDGGFQAAKQFVKLNGIMIMALIVAAESDQVAAITRIARRCAYVLIPLSFMLIKYYPELAIRYDDWSGAPEYFGVAESKNMLGQLCMVPGLILLFALVTRWSQRHVPEIRRVMWIDGGLFLLTVYLLHHIDSATSLLCWGVGTGLFVLLRFQAFSRHIGAWLLSGAIIIGIAQFGFGLSTVVAEAFGRDPTLTNRTEIWKQLLSISGNPIIGTGYEGFWNGPRKAIVAETFHANEAHNGYLETYLNLGGLGLLMFLGVIMSTYKKCRLALARQEPFGQFALPIWVVLLMYNLTEAGWKGQSLIMFLFLFLAVQPVKPQTAGATLPVDTSGERQVLYGTVVAQ